MKTKAELTFEIKQLKSMLREREREREANCEPELFDGEFSSDQC